MARVYLDKNVFDSSLDRIRWVFDEFPEVIVSCSGGKDSTVVLELALQVARERGRLPQKVFWLDQEAEWDCVADHVREIMNRPDVKPLWFQGPFRMSNSTSTGEDAWLHAWREGDKWIRPKEPNSIHKNITGADRFHDLFAAFSKAYFGRRPCAYLAGVRCEESPSRQLALTGHACYKDATWGCILNRAISHYTFYPIYDWSFRDIWKAIHEGGWSYCRLYNYMYQFGIPVRKMRVSNVHHETAVDSLRFLQEIEPDTWNRIVERLPSANAVARVREAYQCPRDLPPMFATWREYRDYLLENLILVTKVRNIMRRQFEACDRRYIMEDPEIEEAVIKAMISAIMVNDYEGTLLGVFGASHPEWGRSRKVAVAKYKADRSGK